MILTATRVSEAAGARWDEINFDGRMWTIPAERMKVGREHRIPLSGRAIDILKAMAEVRTNEFVFAGAKPGTSLTRPALRLHLCENLGVDASLHGFRTTFRSWVASQTNFPWEVAEMALAHTVGDSTERAYMEKPEPANVVPIPPLYD
jgi:integrase